MDGQSLICEKVGSLSGRQLRKTRALIKIKKLYPYFVSEHSYRDIVQIIAEELGADA